MKKQYVRPHNWKGRRVHGYTRKRRPKGKKRIIGKKPIKMYPITDEYGRRLGWKYKR